jgi:hypothetical protein
MEPTRLIYLICHQNMAKLTIIYIYIYIYIFSNDFFFFFKFNDWNVKKINF